MKNIDRIKSLPVWEMAEFIYNVSNNSAKITNCKDLCDECQFSDSYCISQIGEWLNEQKLKEQNNEMP